RSRRRPRPCRGKSPPCRRRRCGRAARTESRRINLPRLSRGYVRAEPLASFAALVVRRLSHKMSDMDPIARLVDEALAGGLGSAAAVSVGDGGREVFRYLAGTARRVPDRGPAIDDTTRFDLASLTKPIATVAIAMVLVAERRLDLDAAVRSHLPDAATTGTVRQLLGHAAGCVAHVELYRHLRAARPAD